MRITVHDTLTQTRKLLDAPLSERPARLEAMLASAWAASLDASC